MDKPKDLTSINDKMAFLAAQLNEKRLAITANLSRLKQRGEELKQEEQDQKPKE